ncbi:MAG: hypothetical protein AAF225_11480 [Pseudomonadota bacterium]
MRKLLTLLIVSVVAACATPTPFEPADSRGYGFADQKIESNRYRISFAGNSLTSREQVENALLLRAAQITLENGYDHFIVVSDDTETEREVRVTDLGPSFGYYGYYGFGRPFPYYGYGYPWGPAFGVNDTRVTERRRYSAVAYIVLGSGPKPTDQVTAYNAREVSRNLEGVVFRKES